MGSVKHLPSYKLHKKWNEKYWIIGFWNTQKPYRGKSSFYDILATEFLLESNLSEFQV